MIKKVLVSQPKPASDKSPYYDIAARYGVDIVFRPFIKVEELPMKDFRQQKVNIPDYTAVVFTSRHAIDHFFRICKDIRYTVPETMRYFCSSETVALYIQKYVQYRKRKIHFGANNKLADLIPTFTKHQAENFLVPTSNVHSSDDVKDLLDSLGVKHTECVMYQTVSNKFTPDEPFDYDLMLFFSPAGIASLLESFPNFEQGERCIGCFGRATAKAVKDAGLRLDLEAPTAQASSITAALEDFIKQRNQ